MAQKLKVLLASRSAEALKRSRRASPARPDVACTIAPDQQWAHRPAARRSPDAGRAGAALRCRKPCRARHARRSRTRTTRPPLIVVGPAGSPEAMRLAIRSGARDFLAEPLNADEFVAALERLRHEPRRPTPTGSRRTSWSWSGAAGGVGTSFVACNLAHAIAEADGRVDAAAGPRRQLRAACRLSRPDTRSAGCPRPRPKSSSSTSTRSPAT